MCLLKTGQGLAPTPCDQTSHLHVYRCHLLNSDLLSAFFPFVLFFSAQFRPFLTSLRTCLRSEPLFFFYFTTLLTNIHWLLHCLRIKMQPFLQGHRNLSPLHSALHLDLLLCEQERTFILFSCFDLVYPISPPPMLPANISFHSPSCLLPQRPSLAHTSILIFISTLMLLNFNSFHKFLNTRGCFLQSSGTLVLARES